MFTHKYKGLWINGFTDKPECYVLSERDGCFRNKTFRSYRAAQIAITNSLK